MSLHTPEFRALLALVRFICGVNVNQPTVAQNHVFWAKAAPLAQVHMVDL